MKPKPEIKSLGKHEAVHRWGYTRVVVVVVMHLGRTFIKHKQKQRERDLRGGVEVRGIEIVIKGTETWRNGNPNTIEETQWWW